MFPSLSCEAEPTPTCRWDTNRVRLDIVLADLDPLVCEHATEAFGAVLQQFSSLPVAVRVELRPITTAVTLTARPPHGQLHGAYMHPSDSFSLCGARAEQEGQSAPCQGSSMELEDDAPVFVVFGGNSAGHRSGNLQRAVSEAFPEAFCDIEASIRMELGKEWDGCEWPQDKGGTVKCSDNHGGFWLISCVTFPRDACHEHHHTQAGFREALELAISVGSSHAVESRSCTVRVITHGLGNFTGHPEPGKFAKSMARGLADFLQDQSN